MNRITQFSRRSFLQSATAFLALPHLETYADNKSATDIKRMIFLGQGYGFVSKSFFPSTAGKFSKIGLTEGMTPLKKYQNDISILGNLENIGATNPHQGSLTFLTGASYANPKGFKNTVSCDQIAASYLCKDTRYNSLTLSTKERASGHGSGVRSMAWNPHGKPISGLNTSLELFNKLFAKHESKEQILRRIKEERSILDAMKLNVRSVNRTLGKNDQEKLDEYFQSIRHIELGLKKQIEWSSVPKPKASFKHPKEVDGEAEVKLMFDMICLALQTDQTRVITYMMPSQSVLSSMGITIPVHSLSHYNISAEREVVAKQRDHKCMELLGYLIGKLKSTKDKNGLNLYDTSLLAYGSNIRNTHTIKDFPVILSGGAIKKLRLGESFKLPKATPLQNVWLTLLQETGVPVKSFSSSTGTVKGILT
ncbi:DUF1552 domain-containing protein [Lentisphaera profundi]|uniref:DUF1552 domain-containing protein n=1 Tax=Lentisphaera profundi TaxID=1658616 RepID=A0ABY7VYM6_9BACT|nr:DUF1552 domain-containing protein [Lentisphaera profundi]WDE99350.1 DUF1552 domain-containing protein [Lentisphaera profundi]